eukprot:364180-Chlamydomonas_euryale.AAC.9
MIVFHAAGAEWLHGDDAVFFLAGISWRHAVALGRLGVGRSRPAAAANRICPRAVLDTWTCHA